MAKGVYRVKDGWGVEDSIWVEYDDDCTRLYELPASQYVAQGYEPPLDNLPLWKKNGLPPDA